MKTFKLILLSFLIFGKAFSLFSQVPTISWPLNYAVYQRDNSTSLPNTAGKATIVFAGQVFNKSSIQYRIEKLNATGSFVSDWKVYQNLPSGSTTALGSSNSAFFYFSLTVPTGWYRFSIKDGSNQITSIKFGVGEVFIIAGQSNAQGFSSQQAISGLVNYDCVVACKTQEAGVNGANIETPTFNTLNFSNPSIGPRGDRPWFYQKLGNSIVNHISGQVIPVCFFNTAVSGTGIDNWYNSMQKTKSMFSNNYANQMTWGTDETHCIAWGCYNSDLRQPYLTFKNVLSLYGNMFGVRTILWHQGEAETKYLLTKNTGSYYWLTNPAAAASYDIGQYSVKLKNVIEDSRSLLGGLPWAISKVSLISEFKASNAKDFNITSSNNILQVPNVTSYQIGNSVVQEQEKVFTLVNNISWASTLSDSYTYPNYRTQWDNSTPSQLDGTHFNEAGLIAIANEIYTNGIPNIFSQNPVLPSAPLKINLVKTSGTYTASAPSGYSYYQLRPLIFSYNGFYPPVFYQMSANMANSMNASSAGGGYIFTKNSSGKIFVVTPNVKIAGVSGAKIANELNTIAYPNPIQDSDQLNISLILEEESPISLSLYTEEGELIDELQEKLATKGESIYQFKLTTSLNSLNKGVSSLILKIVTADGSESKRIILKK